MLYIILLCSVVILAVIVYVIYIICNRKKNIEVFSFKASMELVDLPVITLYSENGRKLHFILDSGTDKSIIHDKFLAYITHSDTGRTHQVYGMEGNLRESKYVNINLVYEENSYQNEFQALDMSEPFRRIKHETGVTIHGLLGTDFFNKYKCVIDFDRLVVYHKKVKK